MQPSEAAQKLDESKLVKKDNRLKKLTMWQTMRVSHIFVIRDNWNRLNGRIIVRLFIDRIKFD